MLNTAKIGRNGTLVIPSPMRRELGITDGGLVLIENTGEQLMIRPATAMPTFPNRKQGIEPKTISHNQTIERMKKM